MLHVGSLLVLVCLSGVKCDVEEEVKSSSNAERNALHLRNCILL